MSFLLFRFVHLSPATHSSHDRSDLTKRVKLVCVLPSLLTRCSWLSRTLRRSRPPSVTFPDSPLKVRPNPQTPYGSHSTTNFLHFPSSSPTTVSSSQTPVFPEGPMTFLRPKIGLGPLVVPPKSPPKWYERGLHPF